MQGIIIDTCKELEITVLTLTLKNTSEDFIFLVNYQFELTVNTSSAKWLYSWIFEAKKAFSSFEPKYSLKQIILFPSFSNKQV